jgi:hypothetical protein
MPRQSRSPTFWTAALLACAACMAGCDKNTSQPTAPPPPTRQVAATLEDTTGASIVGEFVFASRIDAPDDAFTPTDAAGVARFTLADGLWCLSALGTSGNAGLVAGSTGRVQKQPAGSVDSVLFRLVLRPQSFARGKITLAGQSAHGGTLVAVAGLPVLTNTQPDGSYELNSLPPGIWGGITAHAGFQGKLFDVVVPFTGDTVAVATVTLTPVGPVAIARR